MINRLVIQNVVIPINLGPNFCGVDLESAFEYYSNFIIFSKLTWPFAAYVSEIMKGISKVKPGGYNGEQAFEEYLEFFGVNHYGRHVMKLKEEK